MPLNIIWQKGIWVSQTVKKVEGKKGDLFFVFFFSCMIFNLHGELLFVK